MLQPKKIRKTKQTKIFKQGQLYNITYYCDTTKKKIENHNKKEFLLLGFCYIYVYLYLPTLHYYDRNRRKKNTKNYMISRGNSDKKNIQLN